MLQLQTTAPAGASGARPQRHLSTNDNGTRHVKGEIRDQTSASSTYSADVTVNNVARARPSRQQPGRPKGSNISSR